MNVGSFCGARRACVSLATLAVGLALVGACKSSATDDAAGAAGGRVGSTGGSAMPGSGTGGAGGGATGSGGSGIDGGAIRDGSVPDAGGGGGRAGGVGGVGGRGGDGSGGSTGGGAGGRIVDGGDDSRDASSDAGATSSPYDPCPASGDCTVMPLGDSITDGFTVRGGYRIPFFQRAHQEGKRFTFVGSQVNGPATVDNVPFPQRHEGHSAHTIYDAPNAPIPRLGIARYLPTVIPQYNPDIVLLMIGTNDVDGNVDLPNAPNRLGMLIDTIISLDPHSLIVVAQITPTMQDPLNRLIDVYNAGIPAVVKSRADAGKHVALVDMNSAFVRDPAFKTKFLADRLHPNSAGYQVMSDVWNTVVHDLIH